MPSFTKGAYRVNSTIENHVLLPIILLLFKLFCNQVQLFRQSLQILDGLILLGLHLVCGCFDFFHLFRQILKLFLLFHLVFRQANLTHERGNGLFLHV